MGGHTPSQQHERAATWLKLTSVARRSASGAQHSATSHSPRPPCSSVCMCTSLYLWPPKVLLRSCACPCSSLCVCARADACAGARVCFRCAALPGARCEARATAKICEHLRGESVWTRRLGSQRDLEIQEEWCTWVCVWLDLVPDI